MTCAPISLCGLSRTGFICTVGAARAARACSAWARPISPPSTVTAALFDIFCGLNGRTLKPRSVRIRAKPATISDLPTSDPVPWNISVRAATSELNAGLGLHPDRKMMLHKRHFGHQIGRRNQVWFCITTGDNHVQSWPTPAQVSDHGGEIKIFIA